MAALTRGYPSLKQPEDDGQRVWRYMDITKLLHLLTSRQLWFARLDQFRDDWAEGTYPDEQIAANGGRVFYDGVTPKWTFANCWSIDPHESAALWSMQGRERAVAVRTTYRRLQQALPDKVHIGLVRYGVRGAVWHDPNDPLEPAMFKRVNFQFEREVRAFFFLHDFDDSAGPSTVPPRGIPIGPLNLVSLIEAIVTSPFADKDFHETVRAVAGALAPGIQVVASEMHSPPNAAQG